MIKAAPPSGERLRVCVCVSSGIQQPAPMPCVAADGVVRRAAPRSAPACAAPQAGARPGESAQGAPRAAPQVFLDMGLLAEAQLEAAIVSEFNPVRMGFEGRVEVTTTDVLNLGVLPAALVEAVKQRFLAAGGCSTPFPPLRTGLQNLHVSPGLAAGRPHRGC